MAAEDTIKKNIARWVELYKNGDFKQLASLYTEDCNILANKLDVIEGNQACESFWKGLHGSGVAKIDLTTKHVRSSNKDGHVETSSYVMYDGNGKELDRGDYLVIWKRVADELLIKQEMFTTDIMPETIEPREMVIGNNARFQNFFRKGDCKSLSELYAPDCKLFPYGCPAIEGRKGCEDFWRKVKESGIGSVKLHTGYTSGSVDAIGDDVIVEQSKFTMYLKDGAFCQHGKFIVTWTKKDGVWYMQDDIWNLSPHEDSDPCNN